MKWHYLMLSTVPALHFLFCTSKMCCMHCQLVVSSWCKRPCSVLLTCVAHHSKLLAIAANFIGLPSVLTSAAVNDMRTVCDNITLTFCFVLFRFNGKIGPFYCPSVLFRFIPSLAQFWLTARTYSRYCILKRLAVSECSSNGQFEGLQIICGSQARICCIWQVSEMYSSY